MEGMKNPLYQGILTNVLTTLIIGACASYMASKIAISVIETKITYIEDSIGVLQTDLSSTKSLIAAQASTKLELVQFEKRLERLEKRMDERIRAEDNLEDKIRRLELVTGRNRQ